MASSLEDLLRKEVPNLAEVLAKPRSLAPGVPTPQRRLKRPPSRAKSLSGLTPTPKKGASPGASKVPLPRLKAPPPRSNAPAKAEGSAGELALITPPARHEASKWSGYSVASQLNDKAWELETRHSLHAPVRAERVAEHRRLLDACVANDAALREAMARNSELRRANYGMDGDVIAAEAEFSRTQYHGRLSEEAHRRAQELKRRREVNRSNARERFEGRISMRMEEMQRRLQVVQESRAAAAAEHQAAMQDLQWENEWMGQVGANNAATLAREVSGRDAERARLAAARRSLPGEAYFGRWASLAPRWSNGSGLARPALVVNAAGLEALEWKDEVVSLKRLSHEFAQLSALVEHLRRLVAQVPSIRSSLLLYPTGNALSRAAVAAMGAPVARMLLHDHRGGYLYPPRAAPPNGFREIIASGVGGGIFSSEVEPDRYPDDKGLAGAAFRKGGSVYRTGATGKDAKGTEVKVSMQVDVIGRLSESSADGILCTSITAEEPGQTAEGVLHVYASEGNFSHRDEYMAARLARCGGAAVRAAHDFEREREKLLSFQKLLVVGKELSGEEKSVVILQSKIRQMGLSLLNCQHCGFLLFSHEKKTFTVPVSQRYVNVPIAGIAGKAMRSLQCETVDDVPSHPDHDPEVDNVFGVDARNTICLPVPDSEGNIFGVLVFTNKKGRDYFSSSDEIAAMRLVDFISMVLENAQLNESMFDESSISLSDLRPDLSLKEALRMLGEEVRTTVSCQVGVVLLKAGDGGLWVLDPDPEVEAVPMPEAGAVGMMFREHRAITVNDLPAMGEEERAEWCQGLEHLPDIKKCYIFDKHQVASIMVVPLTVRVQTSAFMSAARTRFIGAVLLLNKIPNENSDVATGVGLPPSPPRSLNKSSSKPVIAEGGEELQDLLEYEEMIDQIIMIQGAVRGKQARRRVAELRAQREAAGGQEGAEEYDLSSYSEELVIKIQAAVRGRAARRNVKGLRNAKSRKKKGGLMGGIMGGDTDMMEQMKQLKGRRDSKMFKRAYEFDQMDEFVVRDKLSRAAFTIEMSRVKEIALGAQRCMRSLVDAWVDVHGGLLLPRRGERLVRGDPTLHKWAEEWLRRVFYLENDFPEAECIVQWLDEESESPVDLAWDVEPGTLGFEVAKGGVARNMTWDTWEEGEPPRGITNGDALMFAPLRDVMGRVVGVASVSKHCYGRAFSEEEFHILQGFATIVMPAIRGSPELDDGFITIIEREAEVQRRVIAEKMITGSSMAVIGAVKFKLNRERSIEAKKAKMFADAAAAEAAEAAAAEAEAALGGVDVQAEKGDLGTGADIAGEGDAGGGEGAEGDWDEGEEDGEVPMLDDDVLGDLHMAAQGVKGAYAGAVSRHPPGRPSVADPGVLGAM